MLKTLVATSYYVPKHNSYDSNELFSGSYNMGLLPPPNFERAIRQILNDTQLY